MINDFQSNISQDITFGSRYMYIHLCQTMYTPGVNELLTLSFMSKSYQLLLMVIDNCVWYKWNMQKFLIFILFVFMKHL